MNKLKRKTRKLVRDPKLFFVDMAKKRLPSELPLPVSSGKKSGNHRYTVVSAVYGVEKYLDDYFKSLTRQTLSFEDHIELIMVDDGSTDKSADIVRKWMRKFPNNIRLISKPNGGQASARNYGIPVARHEWITFIDPDDMVDARYFEVVDAELSKSGNDVAMVSCNLIFYREGSKRRDDSHPLRYRFDRPVSHVPVEDMGDKIQLSASLAFFKTEAIHLEHLLFSEKVKPNFEDAHFVNRYLLLDRNRGRRALFLKDAIYLYRKREDGSSTLDTSWERSERYYDVLKYGYLDLLQKSVKKLGFVPKHIELLVLYDVVWYVKYLVNRSDRSSFLSEYDKAEFIDLLRQIFSFIDSNTVYSFSLAGCWFYHKVGIINTFKGEEPRFQIVYLERFDEHNSVLSLRYFTHNDGGHEVVLVDGDEVIPTSRKVVGHRFVEALFVNEVRLDVRFSPLNKLLSVKVDDKPTRLSLSGQQYHRPLQAHEIFRMKSIAKPASDGEPYWVPALRRLAQSEGMVSKFRNCWLIMDRDTDADDNGEHFYRYVASRSQQHNIYFVLRRSSADWKRLKAEGFKLLEYGSLQHKVAVLNARFIISSHADQYVTEPLSRKWFGHEIGYKYIFLQHGITMNDLSGWLNQKDIYRLVTASLREYDSICSTASPYKFGKDRVVLSGFPRHDRLLALNGSTETEKTVIIMPTWRQALVGNTLGRGNQREKVSGFGDSDYLVNWKSFLHSTEFKELLQQNGYSAVFFPHTNMLPYLDEFQCPDYIDVIEDRGSISMQKLFARSAMMITDYSSVAFEMGYLYKPVLYFQFDYDFVFGGGHLTRKGYYDYKTDGFGPVCHDLPSLISAVDDMLSNDCVMPEPYRQNAEETFAFRDGRCCERVYESVIELMDETPKAPSMEMMTDYAEVAFNARDWKRACDRYEKAVAAGFSDPSGLIRFAEALIRSGHFSKAREVLLQIEPLARDFAWKRLMGLTREYRRLLALSPAFSEAIGKVDMSPNGFWHIGAELLQRLVDAACWTAVVDVCGILSQRPGASLDEIYYFWAKASDALGSTSLVGFRPPVLEERRSRARPWDEAIRPEVEISKESTPPSRSDENRCRPLPRAV